MTDISISISGVEELLKKLSKRNINRAKDRFLRAALIELSNQITIEAPVGVSGIMRKRSGYEQFVDPISADYAKLTSKVVYALFVHEGTKPHMPPVGEVSDTFSLARRAKSKGLNPRAVAMSIKKKGTKANPFMKRAAENLQPKLPGMLAKYVDQVLSG